MGVDDWLIARFKPWQVVTVAAVLLGSVLLGLMAFGPSGHTDDIRECREQVKASLKAPSTAEFGEERVVEKGDGATILGAVDAENGFGATVRSDYRCEVTDDGVRLASLDQR